jgi:surface antigen
MAIQSGDVNNFPQGQCTWWADERYHQLTGYYVPWNHTGQANAYQWLARAKDFGWNTGSAPPKGIPSIICLQGSAGQGIESTLGHVAIVEKINGDGSVITSDMNWNVGPILKTVNGYPVRQVVFRQGPGVSFIWAGGGIMSGSVVNTSGGGNSSGGSSGASATPTYTPILDQVHQTLVNVPGFYGIALALDKAEQFPGWVNLVDPSVQAFGVNFDVIGWIRSLGATCTDNFMPSAIRTTLVGLGVFILIMLIVKVVLEVGDKVAPIIQAVGA